MSLDKRIAQGWKFRESVFKEYLKWCKNYEEHIRPEELGQDQKELLQKQFELIKDRHAKRLEDVLVNYVPVITEILTKHGYIKPEVQKLKENYFFITLRPSDDHRNRFKEFKDIVLNKYITRSCFTSYRYAWEQKGETPEEMGKGYHIHILAHCPNWLKKTQLLKDSKSTFTKFFNGEVHESFIQIDYVRTLDHYNNIHAYMSGYKSDDWKDQACEMDKPWRAKMNLEDSYGNLSSKSEA